MYNRKLLKISEPNLTEISAKYAELQMDTQFKYK